MKSSKKRSEPKYKVGQVVAYKHGSPTCPEYFLIRAVAWRIDDYLYHGHRDISQRNLRPLTAREKGNL